jgi:hypothetical protein
VVAGGVRYTPVYSRVPEGKPEHFRAYLLAESGSAYKVMRRYPLYEIRYQPGLETDVQEVHVRSLTHEPAGILAETENGRVYLFDPESHTSGLLPRAMELGGAEGPRIRDARGEPRECSLHRVQLREDVVPIAYGLIRLSPEYSKAARRFPNASTTMGGGCLVGPQRWAKVRFCPECRREQAAWVRQQKAPES